MNVKRVVFFTAFLALAVALSGTPAGSPQDPTAPPLTVAVRVTDAGRFVGGLGLGDFEITVDGEPRPVLGLAEVGHNAVVRQEGQRAGSPVVPRRFHLLFMMYEYDPKIAESLRYFFETALRPGDTLEVQTPVSSYQLTPQALAQKPRDTLAKETTEMVRKDINKGNFIYKSLIKDLRRIVTAIQGSNPIGGGDEAEGGMASYFSLEQSLEQYRDSLAKLDAQTGLDPGRVVGFAQALKKQEGRKFLMLFYQEEYRPELNRQTLSNLITANQDNQTLLSALHELFQVYHREVSFDVDRIVQAYCDSGAEVDFLFLTRTPERFGGLVMRKQSEDVFKLFARIAEATGGVAETAQNPVAEVKSAVAAAEACYLLTYEPGGPSTPGAFRRVSVAVKGKPYKVHYSQGYFAE